MALITRLCRLFKADMHAVIDRLEVPDLQLKQAVRDMEDAVASARRALAALSDERRHIAALIDEANAQQARIAGELDLCFAADDETLARVLLRRRLGLEHNLRRLALRADNLDRDLSARRAALATRCRRLEALREQAQRFTGASAHEVASDTLSGADISDADVELALLAEKHRRAS